MKISLGLAACAALATTLVSGLSASADPALRYDMTGRVCTAEEVANPPIVKVRASKRIVKVRMDCRTEAEWNFDRSTSADNERARKRQLETRMSAPSYSTSSTEGAPVSQSQ